MDAWQLARVSPPCIVMYQLLQNKPPKCATRNPVLCAILSIYKGSYNTFLASKSSWNQTTLDCNSSLLAKSEQNCKSQDSIHLLLSQHSWHHMYNTLNEHNGSPQSYLSDFQRQQFSTVHQASSTGCMKKQGHQQDNPWARWVINSKQVVTETSCQHPPSAVVQVQQ